jgi:sec-independent protein translocase protein TatC
MKLPDDPNKVSMSLGDHLEELRARLILAIIGLVIALILCMCFGKWIILFLEKPYKAVMGDEMLQSLAPMDGFMSYMNVAMIAAVVISSPWIFYQIWQFIAAGLYPNERRYIHLAVPFSAVLFITGALFFIFVIATQTLRFLVAFNRSVIGVNSNFTFTEYISFISLMMLIFGLAFQTPIAIFFLYKTGLVSIQGFCKSRKYVMFVIVVVAACATPGSDPVSLFALSIPMYLLFELGILLSRMSEKKAAKQRPVSVQHSYQDS